MLKNYTFVKSLEYLLVSSLLLVGFGRWSSVLCTSAVVVCFSVLMPEELGFWLLGIVDCWCLGCWLVVLLLGLLCLGGLLSWS